MVEQSSLNPDPLAIPALERGFYQRPTLRVARELLGKLIVRRVSDVVVAVRIVEVEAYLGIDDPACHTYGGRRTARTEVMWGPAGYAYVYLIYGMHHCLNAVTVGPETPEAVLIRGATPVLGETIIRRRRGLARSNRTLVDGPGKLCQALAVTRSDQGTDLTSSDSGLYVVDDGFVVGEECYETSGRVGVDYAAEAAFWPYRFMLRHGGWS